MWGLGFRFRIWDWVWSLGVVCGVWLLVGRDFVDERPEHEPACL